MVKTRPYAPATETYLEVSPLIYSLSRKFARQFKRSDLSEVISQAHYIYHQAYLEYNYKHGVQFTYFAQYKIWKGLLEHWRTDTRRDGLLPRTDMPSCICSRSPSSFDLADFMSRLSLDACAVVRISLKSPRNHFVRYEADGSMTPRSGKKAIRGILKDDLGWKPDRIKRVFAEIRKALS